MIDVTQLPFALVMAQAGPAAPSLLVQLAPFALMLVIFYLLVLMPMKRRQKKVAEFQAGLKVGDRVITTSGIYGQVTRLSEASAQIQIADKVKIEVSRASVGGYQGQEPVVQPESGGL
jgi:preprotein translocase subunit YajC